MFTVDIDDMLDYMICPYRFTFSKKEGFNSFVEIKSYICKHILNHCFLLTVSNQKITRQRLNQKLNYAWSGIRKKFGYHPSVKEMVLLTNVVDRFIDTFGSIENVIYFDIPKTIDVGDLTILYDYSTYIHKDTVRTIVSIDKSHSFINESASTIKIISNMIYYDLKKEIKDNEIYIFRYDTVELYKRVPMEKKLVNQALDYISKGILNKVFFPRTDGTSCRSCKHQKECSWNISEIKS